MTSRVERSLVLSMLAAGLLWGCTDGKLVSHTPTPDAPANLDGGGPTGDSQSPPLRDGGPVSDMAEPACNACHGSAQNAAPPAGLGGETGTSSTAVGAHQAHLGSSSWHAPVRCDDCHIVPTTYVAPGHLDTALPAELTFSALTRTGGATPTWNGTTCAGTYCHGATLDGGAHTAPNWTTVNGSQTTCASCHGMPPGGTHPQSSACADCHSAVVDASLGFVGPNLHIDGKLQLSSIHPTGYASSTAHGADFNDSPNGCQGSNCHGDSLAGGAGPSCGTCHSNWETSCTFCHGRTADPTGAPPESVAGGVQTTVRGVGAHETHLASSNWHAPVTCTNCHVVPNSVFDSGHLGPAPADVSFTALSRANNATPAWNGTTCAGTYCHGATLDGGQHTSPNWTQVDGTQKACDSCHGMPPGAPHPTSSACSTCHTAVIDASNTIIAGNLHIDGTVQTSSVHPANYSQGAAHGPDFNATPNTCKTAACHGDNLGGGAGPSCNSCHSNWQTNCTFCHGGTDNATGAPPEAVAGPTATTIRGVGAHTVHLGTSTWRRTMACTDCHSVPASLEANGHLGPAPAELSFSAFVRTGGATPAWNGATCAGTYCHGATLDGGAHTAPTWTTVDGTQKACTSCHGMPPAGGHTSSTACSTCHGSVINASNQIIAANLHIDGTVQTTSIHPANYNQGPVHGPDFNSNPDSCKTAACHGDSLTGGAGPSCNSCHNNWQTNCTFCHGGTDNTTGAPPEALTGGTNTSLRTVGAHTSHLGSSTWRRTMACTDCHTVPATLQANGHLGASPAELTFSAFVRTNGANPAWNGTTCSGTYCHGTTLDGGAHTAPTWTTVNGTQTTCTSCHGMPPAGGHTNSTACASCHGTVVNSSNVITAPALHIDGTVQTTANHPANYNQGSVHGPDFNSNPNSCKTAACHGDTLNGGAGPSCNTCHNNWQTSCTFCHGGTGGDTTGAPPESVAGGTALSLRQVGAHRVHLGTSTWRRAMACTDCHTVPGTLEASGHLGPSPAELAFSAFVRTDGASPAWNGTTCSGTYCHGATLSGGQNATPTWTTVDGSQTTCTGCHGMPPGGGHSASTACDTCHSSVVNGSNVIIAANLHIDGTVQASGGHPANYNLGTVHGPDFLSNPSSCQAPACHGADLDSGPAMSCNTCHNNWRTTCTFCHGGTDNSTGAPPEDVVGNTATSTQSVGPHTEHVTQGSPASHPAYSCATCHNANYSDAMDPGHIGASPGDVDFTGISGGSASYNSGTGTCSNIYCHGNGRGGTGSATFGSTTISDCASCHDDGTRSNGTLGGRHDLHVRSENMECVDCHQCMVNASMAITDPTQHVDGNVDFCPQSWVGRTTGTSCNPACHGTENWYN